MISRYVNSNSLVRAVVLAFLALLLLGAANQVSAGPQHYGFGFPYFAALKEMGGRTNLVVYEAPIRAKDTTWMCRWMDRTSDFSNVVPGGLAIGNFWPVEFGKEYLVLVGQSGTTATIRVMDAPECFKVGAWTQKSTANVTLTAGDTIIAATTGRLKTTSADQLVLLVSNGSTIKVIILNSPTTVTSTNWSIYKTVTVPGVTGTVKGFAVGDFWGDGAEGMVLATSVSGATALTFYSYSNSGLGSFSTIVTDAATDLPQIAQNGITATDFHKDKFDVIVLAPSDPGQGVQCRIAPAKPGQGYNVGPYYDGHALSRQLLPGNGGASSVVTMTGALQDGGAAPTSIAAGRVFGYIINMQTSRQAIASGKDAEIVYTHRTPLKNERPPYGWPTTGETVNWEINLKNNGLTSISSGSAMLKVWINTPYRNADTNPATCDSPNMTIPINSSIPAFDSSNPHTYIKRNVSCQWPYELVPTEPGSSYMRINLRELGERWLVISMDCAGDTNLRNNRYEAMIAGWTFHPSFRERNFTDDRGPSCGGDPSSWEYLHRKLADAVLNMWERSGTHDNQDVLQRPYFDGFEVPIPEDLPPEEQAAQWEYIVSRYEGWRSLGDHTGVNQTWERFDWQDGGAELHETGHLYHPLGDLYQYYAYSSATTAAKMADGTPVQLYAYVWYPDSFGLGNACINQAAAEYMKNCFEGTRIGGLPSPDSNWSDLAPEQMYVRVLDRDGNPVPNAEVTMWKYADTTPVATGTTGADGRWNVTPVFGTPITNMFGRVQYPGWANNGLTWSCAQLFTVKIGDSYQDCDVWGLNEKHSHSRVLLIYQSFVNRHEWTWDFKTNYKAGAPEPSFTAEAAVQGYQVNIGVTGNPGATYRVYRRWEPAYIRTLVGEYYSANAKLDIPQSLYESDTMGGGRYKAIYEVTEMTPGGESLPRTMTLVGVMRLRGVASRPEDGKILAALNAGHARPFCELFEGTTPYSEFFFHFRFGHMANKIVASINRPGYYYATLIGPDMTPEYSFDLIVPPPFANNAFYDASLYIGSYYSSGYSTTEPYTITATGPLYKLHKNDLISRNPNNAFVIDVTGNTVTSDILAFPPGSVNPPFNAERLAGRPGTRADWRELMRPRGMDVLLYDGDEYIAIADAGNRRVVIWDEETGYVAHHDFADTNAIPAGIARHPLAKNKIFVLDRHTNRASKLYLFSFNGTSLTVEPGYPVSINTGNYGDGNYWREMGLAAVADPGAGSIVLAITDGVNKKVTEMKQSGGTWQVMATHTQATGTYVGSAALQGPLDVTYVVTPTGLTLYASDIYVGNETLDRLVKITSREFESTTLTPSGAKTKADGTLVRFTGSVSARFGLDEPIRYYVESPDRSSGIQVRSSSLPAMGRNVQVDGIVYTDPLTHERYVEGEWVEAGGTQTIDPVALNTKALGGGPQGLQEGVYQGAGLGNIGLLVRTAGRVTATTADGVQFYLSDGSGANDGSGPDGIKVDLSGITEGERPRPMIGDKVIATGVSSMYAEGGNFHRSVRMRSASDFTNLATIAWSSITGPVNDSTTYNHIGTDGTSLYAVFGSQKQLWRYTFSQNSPAAGTWTQLAVPIRTVYASNSYSDLAYQNGYLYTSALPSSGGGRTIIRYRIADNTWQAWQNGSTDITLSGTTGNGMFMDPTTDGVGYSASETAGYWVQFDWNAKTANNTWMSTAGLGVTDAGYVSRSDDSATDGAGIYYATKNDQTAGLSGGDVVYSWAGLATPVPVALIQKPWQAGLGQSIEFVPASMAPSSSDELWMVRGADGAINPGYGTGVAKDNWARLNLADVGSGWSTANLPGTVGYTGELVRIGRCLFVRGQGTAWYVTKL